MPEQTDLESLDLATLMRRAFALAGSARAKGNHPFGALLCDRALFDHRANAWLWETLRGRPRGIAVGTTLTGGLRTDPYVRNYPHTAPNLDDERRWNRDKLPRNMSRRLLYADQSVRP